MGLRGRLPGGDGWHEACFSLNLSDEEASMGYRILIVDDESATVFGLKALLESDQVRVFAAVNAEAAKEVLRGEAIDVMVSDIRLSGTLDAEGLDLLEFVRSHHPSTRVILMTGYGDPAIMQRAYDMGASFYFEKPVELSLLSRAIHDLGVPGARAGGSP
jgi:two-component system response regulator CpxR